MKKVIPTTWLKAITTLYFLLITLFTSSAQQGNWEIGIGLRPLNLKDEPYSLILKRHFTPQFALRLGLGCLYNERDKFVEYIHPYLEGDYNFNYEYNQVEKKFYSSSFIGLQYLGSKRSNVNKKSLFDWYLFSDLIIKYNVQKTEIPNGVLYIKPLLKPGDQFYITSFGETYTLVLGVRQGIGIQYTLDKNTTLGLEGGIYYENNMSSIKKNSYHYSREGMPTYEESSIVVNYLPKRTKNYQWQSSLITLISFQHYF
jgi:hypothetical protein